MGGPSHSNVPVIIGAFKPGAGATDVTITPIFLVSVRIQCTVLAQGFQSQVKFTVTFTVSTKEPSKLAADGGLSDRVCYCDKVPPSTPEPTREGKTDGQASSRWKWM